jgi:hypothetical protein
MQQRREKGRKKYIARTSVKARAVLCYRTVVAGVLFLILFAIDFYNSMLAISEVPLLLQ